MTSRLENPGALPDVIGYAVIGPDREVAGLYFGKQWAERAIAEYKTDPRIRGPYRVEPLVLSERNPRWVCEFCFATVFAPRLPSPWDFVWQSAVCPSCQTRVKADGGYGVVKGGAYADGASDPRAMNPPSSHPSSSSERET